ncbi:MAG: bifunctional adenosylcobinamide kinase/adenosylcobinamide-phosphate guanylyltransferase [Cyanobacteria bacterium J06639_1]
MPHVLVTGPTRSGKSAFAETLAAQTDLPVTYVATARASADDPEWQARIDRHRRDRPDTWKTLEEPLELAAVLEGAEGDRCYLIDSLGTWVANWIEAEDSEWDARTRRFLDALSITPATVIMVAEEVGWGVVPAYPLGRTFRDRLGLLAQDVGAIAARVYLVAAGYAIDLKQYGQAVR